MSDIFTMQELNSKGRLMQLKNDTLRVRDGTQRQQENNGEQVYSPICSPELETLPLVLWLVQRTFEQSHSPSTARP